MGTVNRVMLLGNLGHDPELRRTKKGNPVANFSMATHNTFKQADGTRGEDTQWHKVVAFGRQAEVCCEYLRKGGAVWVEGRLQTRGWEDKEGQQRKSTEVVLERMAFVGGRPPAGTSGVLGGARTAEGQPADLPF